MSNQYKNINETVYILLYQIFQKQVHILYLLYISIQTHHISSVQ